MILLRNEYKYLVPVAKLEQLRSMIEPYVELDPFAAKCHSHIYTVRSIYFDNTSLKYYHEKVEGLKNRKKIRIRSYNELNQQSPLFLEIKRKYNQRITKTRAVIYYRDTHNVFCEKDIKPYLLNGKKDHDPEVEARQFFFHYYKDKLQPTILVVYDREAFYDKFNPGVRITFDRNLRSLSFPTIDQLFVDGDLQPSLLNYFVLEIKCPRGIPAWLSQITASLKLRWQAVSKYVICVDTQKKLRRFVKPPDQKSIFVMNGA